MSAVMNMIPQSAIPTMESLPEQPLKTSLKIGSAPCVQSVRRISPRQNKRAIRRVFSNYVKKAYI